MIALRFYCYYYSLFGEVVSNKDLFVTLLCFGYHYDFSLCVLWLMMRFFGWAGFSKRLFVIFFVITIYSRSLLSSYPYIMMAQNEPELFGEEVSVKDFSMSFLCLTLPPIFTWADNLYYNLTFCCVSELMIEIHLLIEVHF